MSQIPTENEDNGSVAASDFIQFDQQEDFADQQEGQQEHPQFGCQKNLLDWTMDTGSISNYGNGLKELKLVIANLEAKNQTFQVALANLQGKLENLELKAEIRALKQNAEQKANYQALKDKFAKMLSTQNGQHQKEMAQLESKNQNLEEKLSAVEVQTKGTIEKGINEALEGKIEQLKDEFSKMLAEQRKQIMACKGKILANPKGNVWNGFEVKAIISACGLKVTKTGSYGQYVFATKGYAISGELCQNFPFLATIIYYYYEVTLITPIESSGYSVGLTNGSIPAGGLGGSNSYAIDLRHGAQSCWLAGREHKLESQKRTIADGAVVGCGILLNSKNQVAIFFTLNGILIGKQTPIYPWVDRLYPTVYLYQHADISLEANLGSKLAVKPFKFDIDHCPGLVFE